MNRFIFDGYEFDQATRTARFKYYFEDTGEKFTEIVKFADSNSEYDHEVLARALNLAHLVIGVSYYKTFPTKEVGFLASGIDAWQAKFLNAVYQEGLSQFAYENKLTRSDLARFEATGEEALRPISYTGDGVISLQSGGKDSLLVAALLDQNNIDFSSLYISSTDHYPQIIDAIGKPVRLIRRQVDKESLLTAKVRGAKNGHVPVTFIVLALSLVQGVLDNKNTILSAVGHEGEEPHGWIDDLPVTHQWSKTWEAEQLFSEYIIRYVSPDLRVGSVLRKYSELRIAELFVDNCWERFGHAFSSCNRANYKQGTNNESLAWCGDCPKCANSYLLFAPFVDASDLKDVFGGKDLFEQASLGDTFKGLLGIDNAMKPFECVGEIDELRYAYTLAMEKEGFAHLPFDVPASEYDYLRTYPSQEPIDLG